MAIPLAQAPKLLPLPFHLMKKTFFIEGGFLKSLPIDLPLKTSDGVNEKQRVHQRGGEKIQQLCIEHNSCMPGIVKPVNSKKRGVSLHTASGRAVIQYTMKCRWVISGSRIKYSGSLWFYHKTTNLPTLVV